MCPSTRIERKNQPAAFVGMDKAPRPSPKTAPPASGEGKGPPPPATSRPRAESNLTEFPILQFGASRFLQAHVDLFVSDALPRGEAMGRIAVAGTTGSPESRRRVAAFVTGQPHRVPVKSLRGRGILHGGGEGERDR